MRFHFRFLILTRQISGHLYHKSGQSHSWPWASRKTSWDMKGRKRCGIWTLYPRVLGPTMGRSHWTPNCPQKSNQKQTESAQHSDSPVPTKHPLMPTTAPPMTLLPAQNTKPTAQGQMQGPEVESCRHSAIPTVESNIAFEDRVGNRKSVPN